MLKPGEKQKLKVLRKTDIGYMLVTKNQEEVFLHNNETNYQKLHDGMTVNAFLFYDNKKRLAATLYEPIISKDESNWLEVVGVNHDLGVFLNNGINKDLLLSKDNLPNLTSQWPKNGDKVYVSLVVKNRLTAEFNKNYNLELEPFEPGQKTLARVVNIGPTGLTLVTDGLTQIFVDYLHLRKEYRIGQEVSVTINFKHEEFYSGQLILKKEDQRLNDAEEILNYLKRRKEMNLTSNSSPEEIRQLFNMSKNAFKRALGALYKDRLIDFVDDKTILVGENNE